MPIDFSTGIPLLPMDELLGETDDRPGEKRRRLLLLGGPWGPMYHMGIMPDFYDGEEEEDPNP